MGCGPSIQQIQNRQKQLKNRLSEKQIGIVQDTLPLIAKDITGAGLIAFEKLFLLSPDLKPHFGLRQEEPFPADDPILNAHAGAFVSKLAEAVVTLNDTGKLAEIISELGENHVARNVSANDLKRLWPAIDHMLREVMLYAYTVEVREAWRAIFDFLVERMEIGMRQTQEKRDKAV